MLRSDPVIKVSDIHKSFGNQVLFEGLTFNVNRRERVGLVGRNGHGKTTLFRMLLGQIAPDGGTIMIPRRYRIAHVEQQLRFSEDTVLKEAALGLTRDNRHETWRAEKVLAGLGFSEGDMALPPERFSGGFQVRLNLAKAVLNDPDLLLLDEPTNYLDVISIRWLSRFLRSWPSELMLITHDRSFMDSVVTHTVGIHRRRAKKIEGDTGKLYDQILQEEEIYEKTRINDEKKRKEIERFIERFRAKNTLATRVQSRIKYLSKHEKIEKLDRIQTLDFSFNPAPFHTKTTMRIDDLSFGFGSGPDLLSSLSFEIHAHDRICVIGANGRGKSTLLRLLAGDLSPRRGSITRHNRVQLGYFAQTNVDTLDPRRTVVDEILSADAGCVAQTARNVAGSMMFGGDDGLKTVSILSGGEKSRVMLGKLIVAPSNVLLLDEPTNHLDMDSCDSLLAAIDAYDGAVVVVTHNEMFLHTLATRFIVFDRGTVRLFDGSYQEFLERVGWETDHIGATETPARKTAATANKKAMRQARARILRERSQTISPLQKRIDDLEMEIVELEKKARTLDTDLENASVRGEPKQIADLSRERVHIKNHIDRLFEALASTTDTLEATQCEFDRRLQELE